MKKDFIAHNPLNRVAAFFILIALSIFIFGCFFVIQLSLHNTVYQEDNAALSIFQINSIASPSRVLSGDAL